MVNKRIRKKQAKKKLQNHHYQFPVGKKTLEEYKREAKNTRSKLNRDKRIHGIDNSNKIVVPPLESFQSRKQFKDWVKEVKHYRNRSNPDFQYIKNEWGYSASKSRVKRMEQKSEEERKKATKEMEKLKNLPFFYKGEDKGTVGMQRPNATGIYVPNRFDFNNIHNEDHMREYEERANKRTQPLYFEEKMETMRSNFVTILGGSFNSLADELIDKINDLHPSVFYQIYLMNFTDFDFELYDTAGQELAADESYLGRMLKHISDYENGHTNIDLWHPNFR